MGLEEVLSTVQNGVIDIETAIQELEGISGQLKKRPAIVEQIAPEKDADADEKERAYGRVKIRVPGMHPASKKVMPTEELPWTKIALESGSSSGIGRSVNLLVGQWVEITGENAANTSLKIIGNIATIVEDITEDNAFGNIAEGELNKLLNKIMPDIGTGDLEKLANTIFNLVNSNLLKFWTGDGKMPDDIQMPDFPLDNTNDPTDPTNPGVPFIIEANLLDWTLDSKKIVTRLGKNLWSINEAIKIDGRPPTTRTAKIEIITISGEDHPGNIVGADFMGDPVYATYLNNQLVIPPNVTEGIYTIRYRVSRIADLTVFAENNIIIKVVSGFSTTNNSPGAKSTKWTAPLPLEDIDYEDDAPKHIIIEPPETADKAEYPYNKVDQGVEDAIVIQNDSSPLPEDAEEGDLPNRRYCITHKPFKDDSEMVSRFDMAPGGDIIIKASQDQYMLTGRNLIAHVRNVAQITVDEYFSLEAKTIFIKGHIRLEGSLAITEALGVTGNTYFTSPINAYGGCIGC